MKNNDKSRDYMFFGGRISKVGKVVVSIAALGLGVASCDFMSRGDEPVMGAKRAPEKNIINPGVEKQQQEELKEQQEEQGSSLVPTATPVDASSVQQLSQMEPAAGVKTAQRSEENGIGSWFSGIFSSDDEPVRVASAERKVPVENMQYMVARTQPVMQNGLDDAQLATLPALVSSAPVGMTDQAIAPVQNMEAAISGAPVEQNTAAVQSTEQVMTAPVLAENALPPAQIPQDMKLATAVSDDDDGGQVIGVIGEEVVAELPASGTASAPAGAPVAQPVDSSGYPLLGATPQTPAQAQAFKDNRAEFDGKMESLAAEGGAAAPLTNELPEQALAAIPADADKLPWKQQDVANAPVAEREEFGDAVVTYADKPAEATGAAETATASAEIPTAIPVDEETVVAELTPAPEAGAVPTATPLSKEELAAAPAVVDGVPTATPVQQTASLTQPPMLDNAYDKELVESAAPAMQAAAPAASSVVEEAIAAVPPAQHGAVSLETAPAPVETLSASNAVASDERPSTVSGFFDAVLAPFRSEEEAPVVEPSKHASLAERTAEEIQAAAQPAPQPLAPMQLVDPATQQPSASPLAVISEAPAVQEAAPAAGYETAQAGEAQPDYIELVPPSPRVSGDVRYLPESRYASRVKQRPQNTDTRH